MLQADRSKRPRRRLRFLVGLAWACTLLGHGAVSGATLTVIAGVEPVSSVAAAVGGDRVEAVALVPSGQSPHNFEPTPRQLAALEDADLYFAVGMPFEGAWVSRLQDTFPDIDVVALTAPADDRGDRSDPHPWTDPIAAVEMADRVRLAMAQADPAGAGSYEEGAQALARRLEEAHRAMQRTLAPVRGRPFLVYHPAWGALAGRYDLDQWAVESGGKSPGARHLAETLARARAAGVCAVFAQPQFSSRAARQVADDLGVPVVTLDPLKGDLPVHLPEVARVLARYMESPCPQ